MTKYSQQKLKDGRIKNFRSALLLNEMIDGLLRANANVDSHEVDLFIGEFVEIFTHDFTQ